MDLQDFLDEPMPSASKCICCNNVTLAADIVAWLDALVAGKTAITLSYFHAKYLLPTYGKPGHVDSVRNHVRRCLKRSISTGKPLKS